MTCSVFDHSQSLARCARWLPPSVCSYSHVAPATFLNMWTQPQRPAVLVVFTEDGYREAANYQLDLKFPPQYIPKQYRNNLIMDTSPGESQCTIVPSIRTPVKQKRRPNISITGTAAGSYTKSVARSDSVVIPLRTPNERATPRRPAHPAHPLRRTLISGYWSPVSCCSTNSGPTCRICLEGNANEDLISPCDCRGTLKLIHRSCLEKWLTTSSSKKCEVCRHGFDVQHDRKPFWKWFTSNDPANGPQGFYSELICVLVLSSMCIGSVYMCALGAASFIKLGSWKGPGLIVLCVTLSILCLLFLVVTFKFHYKQLRKWQTSNQLVHLVQWKDVHQSDQRKREDQPIRFVSRQNPQFSVKIREEQSVDSLTGNCSPNSFTTIDLESSFTNLEEST